MSRDSTNIEDEAGDPTPRVDSTNQMPSMVEQTITEGLDESDLEELRTINRK